MLVIASAADPVFVSVTLWTPLVMPTTSLPRERFVGERETLCAEPETASDARANIARKHFVRVSSGGRITAGSAGHFLIICKRSPDWSSRGPYEVITPLAAYSHILSGLGHDPGPRGLLVPGEKSYLKHDMSNLALRQE